MQGPTVSPVFCKKDGKVSADYYAIVICVPKKALYKAVQQLRAVMLFPLEIFLSCYHVPLVALSVKGLFILVKIFLTAFVQMMLIESDPHLFVLGHASYFNLSCIL